MWYSFSSVFGTMSIRVYRIKSITIFLIFFFIYLINRILKKYISIPLIGYICKNHLNDFIGGFLFCIYINMLLVLNNKKPICKFYILFLIMLCVSLTWEYVFPIFLSYSTSDFFDIIAYMLGTILYYLMFNKLNKKIIE